MDVQQMSPKKIPVLFIAVIAIAWAVFFYTSQPMNQNREAFAGSGSTKSLDATDKENVRVGSKNVDTVAVNATDKAPAKQNATAPTEQLRTLEGTPAEAEVVRQWRESTGTFLPGTLADYESYDIDTLKQMVESGDLKAMSVLADKYLSPEHVAEYGLNYAVPLLNLAAAHGSTDALASMAVLNRPQLSLSNFNQGDRRALLVESLAWGNAAALRGDKMANYHGLLAMRSANIKLSSQDISLIRQRSEEIYEQVLTHRRSLGLGDFDNTVPPEVDRFFSHLENYMDQKPMN